MICPNCGANIRDDEKYCEYCGTKIKDESETVEAEVFGETSQTTNYTQTKSWLVLGKIGYVLSIIAIVTCWLPFISLEVGPVGIVLSALGIKAEDEENKMKARKALKRSIIATCIAFALLFIYFFIFFASTFAWFEMSEF